MLKIHLIVCSSKGWGFGNVTEVGVRWKHWFLGTSNQIYASSSLQRKSSESWKLAGFHSSDNIKRGVNKDLQGLHHSISNRVQKWKSKHRIFSFRETWYHNWFFSASEVVSEMCVCVCVCVCVLSTQSCSTLCEPVEYSPPGSFVHGILPRILEWLVSPFFRGSSQPRDRTWVSRIAGRLFTIWATREVPLCIRRPLSKNFN